MAWMKPLGVVGVALGVGRVLIHVVTMRVGAEEEWGSLWCRGRMRSQQRDLPVVATAGMARLCPL